MTTHGPPARCGGKSRTAQESGGWGESYTYDGFDNLSAISPTGQGGETWSAVINESTNRLQGVNYDANGNQIGDQMITNYVWNVENRMVQQFTAGGTTAGPAMYYTQDGGRHWAEVSVPDQREGRRVPPFWGYGFFLRVDLRP